MNLCWIQQYRLNRHLDKRETLPPRLEKHLKACKSCRQHYETQWEAVHLLSRKRPAAPQPSPHLETRILNRVRAEQRSFQATPPMLPGWLYPAAVTTGIALLVGFVLILDRSSAPAESDEIQVAHGSHASPLPVPLTSPNLAITNGYAFVELGEQLEKPLETEMTNVLADARNAVQLLAHNFLPDRVRGNFDW